MIGRFVLREAQWQGVREIRAALRQFGGAVVADAAGSGKTVLALATAAAYADVLVIVPAAVRGQWARAAARAQVAIRVATQEALSRGRAPAPAALVIVDEAHHFRNPASARYRVLASVASGRHLLLLTATPVVNRRRDRDALLALFLGRSAATPHTLERVVIRRVGRARRPRVLALDPLPTAADVPGVARALQDLPPPLPAADGVAATALVRSSLAFAWASSLAALDAALRRRLQRGAALADVLRDGRWPTRDALRDWIVGADATQLAFDFTATDATRGLPRDALATLETHLDAVRSLRALVRSRIAHDAAARADALRALIVRESPRRILLLAHHAESVRALYQSLRDLPGTVAIIGARVHAAAGRWSRDEVLQRLGPDAPPVRNHDIREIRLLLATDILAEGVELQGCATLVHGDGAWTPARLEQRLGRVARDGQRSTVHVTHFMLPAGAERLLALGERLRQKRRARAAALAGSDAQAALREALAEWVQGTGLAEIRDDPHPTATAAAAGACVAAAWAMQAGFLALLEPDADVREGHGRDRPAPRLIAGLHRDGRWQVSARGAVAAACVRATQAPAPMTPVALRTVRHLLRQWQRRDRARAALTGASALDPGVLRHAMRRVDAWFSDQPIARRPTAAQRLERLRQILRGLRGVAAERRLQSALREESADACLAAIERLASAARADAPAGTWRLSALLVLRPRSPDAPAPPTPSPGSAAIR